MVVVEEYITSDVEVRDSDTQECLTISIFYLSI